MSTLGVRIQEGRKAAGLSQEALGEKLQVSRQAVSKWESDAAIPELDKLIAMSRIFGVTIEQLLGIQREEAAEEKAENAGEWSERELRALETIAARYATVQAQPAKKLPRYLLRGAALLVILALCIQVQNLNGQYQSLQNQMDSVQTNLTNQIIQMSTQISNILEEKNSILENCDVQIEQVDAKRQEITISVIALPKEQEVSASAQMTAVLSDGRHFAQEAEATAQGFTVSQWCLPMDSEIRIGIQLTQGSSVQNRYVWTLYAAPEEFRPVVSAFWGATAYQQKHEVRMEDLSLHISMDQNLLSPWELKSVDLCLCQNHQKEPETVLPVTEAVQLWQETGAVGMDSMTDYHMTFTLEDQDTMTCLVRVKDNWGQTTDQVLNEFFIDQNGNIDTRDSSWMPSGT